MRKQMDSKKKNMPIKKFRAGNFELAVWNNERDIEGETVSFKTLTLSRSYKKKEEDIWRSEIINLRKQDLHKLMVLLNEGSRHIWFGDSNE